MSGKMGKWQWEQTSVFWREVVGFRYVFYVICGVNVPDEYLKGTCVRFTKFRMKLTPTNFFPNLFQPRIPSIRSPSISLPQKRSGDQEPVVKFLIPWMSYTHMFLFGSEKCQVFYLPFLWSQVRFQRFKKEKQNFELKIKCLLGWFRRDST